MKYLIANWKSNKTLTEMEEWVKGFKGYQIHQDIRVVVCPVFSHGLKLLDCVKENGVGMEIGSQDVSPFPFGAYTGAVTAEQVKEFGTYAIVGHSERRKYFYETHQDVANKIDRLLENNLTPILCVDEPYVEMQLAAIRDEVWSKLVVAYEPLAAIGSGVPDTPEHAAGIVNLIKEKMDNKAPVLYGGPVDSKNAKGFLDTGVIDGFLVGGKSLVVESWKSLIEACG